MYRYTNPGPYTPCFFPLKYGFSGIEIVSNEAEQTIINVSHQKCKSGDNNSFHTRYLFICSSNSLLIHYMASHTFVQ